MKLKNLPDVHSILLGAEENDFQLSVHKERRVKLRVTFETFRGKNQHLLGKLISRNDQNVHLSDVHDRFQVIKIFHSFLYSIEINLNQT